MTYMTSVIMLQKEVIEMKALQRFSKLTTLLVVIFCTRMPTRAVPGTYAVRILVEPIKISL
jgi:hypothetical protein